METNESVKSFSITNISLNIRYISALKSSIEVTKNLKELVLKKCMLTDDHIEAIKTSIAEN
jgi:hypothetical protein